VVPYSGVRRVSDWAGEAGGRSDAGSRITESSGGVGGGAGRAGSKMPPVELALVGRSGGSGGRGSGGGSRVKERASKTPLDDVARAMRGMRAGGGGAKEEASGEDLEGIGDVGEALVQKSYKAKRSAPVVDLLGSDEEEEK